MTNLQIRSYQKELMDEEDIPFPAIAQSLKELNFINTWLGGHSITCRGLKHLNPGNKAIKICEIGCGGGDNLLTAYNYYRKKGIEVQLIGIDLKPECIDYARIRYPQLPCEWICSDYKKVDLSASKPDIIFSSLFCHHFTDDQIVPMLQWLAKNSQQGFFINDLHRHWLAYYLIKYLTKFFSQSYLVRNDACLSVARSFRKSEWFKLFQEAGVTMQAAEWKWAFRWLVTSKKTTV
jgi:2-polyprenyl-3-methyl-5-hydroxy-6-metoxy-1,4-benzoquinol methylase